ncbi:phosphoribosylanthranilate isomerase [Roseiarcus fermentans]|uniref:N-(5'-phosphoribosyl)anthranilate isomerase n=1 Tax=Roseiarcus fermentans TaxID=1473586 RepID=A0A366EPZ7_9HYPH|nr:phosphoribosylanthranilate isomerase [Roseiarcus fermentans]RBP03555.1 phosphoribosylanthranilate isomerase [Roseiarcus fermentans]
MTPLVKICGLSTPESLDAAIAAGADMVGFVFFARSPRHIDFATARALGRRARGRATIVALTVDADDALLSDVVEALDPDMLQFHGKESPERVAAIGALYGRRTLKAVGVAAPDDLAAAGAYDGAADFLLIDAKPPKGAALPGGNGLPFDWRLARDFAPRRPWLLSGGLAPDNVAAAIRATGARGVDVSSGVESAPGVKDETRIAAFVAAARTGLARTPLGAK